ncbi:site-specific DNA-methyltransferase [candidate division WOR-3 bacterium]|nr:site-specific DNA-methyltransferase [candidate division WOR-3 bacterium]
MNETCNKTIHELYVGGTDEELRELRNASVQLIVTSPPYWNARDYKHHKQIGFNDKYEEYLIKMGNIFKECIRILLPDGKIALNMGNIYSNKNDEKRKYTVNLILDLWKFLDKHKDLKFMGTIYWKKTTSRNGAVLFGSYPYPSNFMISTALEAIHVFRKIGRRKVSKEIKEKSRITKEEFRKFREPIWYLNGVSKKEHPAVFPNELPYRLIKMYSFYGNTVLDPFCGIGTTNLEALKLNRNSIGIDIKKEYIDKAMMSLKETSKHASILVFYKNKVKKYEQ